MVRGGLQAELAMEWLLQQAHIASSPAMSAAGESVTEDESFVADQDVRVDRPYPSASYLVPNVVVSRPAQAVAMLKGMGFEEEAVIMALRATNNDPDTACSWLMDSAGDANGEISGLVSHEDSGDALSQSMQDELDKGWQAASTEGGSAASDAMVTPAPVVSATPSMLVSTPAPLGTEPRAPTQRGTSLDERGRPSGFTVPSSASSTLHDGDVRLQQDQDESSFAIQRPATSPRGSTIARRPMQPGRRVPARISTGARGADMNATSTNNCGITPNNLFHQRTASQFATTGPTGTRSSSGAVISAAFSAGAFSHTGGSDTPRGNVPGTLFSPPDQLENMSGGPGSSTRDIHFTGLDGTLDLNNSSATLSGGDTPGVLKEVQALSDRARAAEEIAVSLQTEVEQQMMRNEMLGRQLQDERAAKASVSKQLRQVRILQ